MEAAVAVVRETSSPQPGPGAVYTLTGKEGCELFQSVELKRADLGCPTDLPVMLNKSWQTLAESHTELTWTDSKDGGFQHGPVEMVGTSKKPTDNVHLDPGHGENEEPSVQKPEPAVVAEAKA